MTPLLELNNGVEMLVDVRRFPGSRRHPHFAGDALARFPHDAPYAHRVAWAPDGAFVAASLCGDRVRLWDTRS